MKKSLLLITLLAICLSMTAQNRPGQFNSFADMPGNTVQLPAAYALFTTHGAYLYSYNGGVGSKIQDRLIYKDVGRKLLSVKKLVEASQQTYLLLGTDITTYCIPVDPGFDILKEFISITFWEKEFTRIKSTFKYVDNRDFGVKVEDRYEEVTWDGYSIPEHASGEVIFNYRSNGGTYTATYSSIIGDESCFVSTLPAKTGTSTDSSKKAPAQTSAADRARVFEAKVTDDQVIRQALDAAGLRRVNSQKFVASVFSYSGNNSFEAILLGQTVNVKGSSLQFEKASDKEYLTQRGQQGRAERLATAKANDASFCQAYKNEIQKEDKERALLEQKIEAVYRKEQILIDKCKLTQSAGDWIGLDFTFHNCFDQTIKYIEATIVACNEDDAIAEKDVRYSGPLAPGKTESVSFDKIFKDSYDIIQRLEVYDMNIVFTNGKSINWYDFIMIMLHAAKNCDELQELLQQKTW